MKILLITNIPNPYRIPLFNELNRKLTERGDDLFVAFGAEGYKRRKWKFNLEEEARFSYQFLKSKLFRLGSDEKVLFTYGGLFKLYKQYKPDAVVVTGFSLAALKLWFLSFFRKLNYIIWSGSILTENRNSSLLRKIFRKILVKKAKAFIAYGTLAREYFKWLGAPEEKIFIAINTVDTEFFRTETEKIGKEIKKDPIHHLTYIGELTPRKNVLKLLLVIKQLKKGRQDFVLDIIGDGAEKMKLTQFVEDNGLKDFVIFHGYKQKQEIPYFFAISSCFLFQTDFDIWGLVLVEAMAAGVPCIASIHAGASHDLIIDNETGFKADFEKADYIVEKINYLFSNPAELHRISMNARLHISTNFNLVKSAEGFIISIEDIFRIKL